MSKLEQHCRNYQDMLTRAEARKVDLDTRGDDAISEHDKRYGYDLEFNRNLNTHHISHATEQLRKCPPRLIEMTPAELVTVTTPVERPTLKQTVLEQPAVQGRLW